MELPEDKRPPRGIWDKPYAMKNFLREVSGTSSKPRNTVIEVNEEDIE